MMSSQSFAAGIFKKQGTSPVALVHLLSLSLCLAVVLPLSGCRTTSKDVHRWANTSQGPRKLVAVLTHDRYPLNLRVEAAMTLVEMKPRGGRRVGIQGSDEQVGLVDALAQLPAGTRKQIVKRMVPRLVDEMTKPPPQGDEPDLSFPYKDAAFALLTHDDGALITSEETRTKLREGLVEWSVADFARRMDDSSQLYGLEQVLRYLKAQGAARLPELIQTGSTKIDRLADLIADLGDEKTKLLASKRLVKVAQEVASDDWKKKKAPDVAAANEASKLKPTKEQFAAQLAQYQEEELLRVFTSMKRVGQEPIVNYLLSYAADESQDEKRRAAALAALEGHLDRKSSEHASAVLDLASRETTPDVVRDQALRRAGELPREVVVGKLYSLFSNDNWKVRWVAAELILQMSKTEHVPEFMRRLSKAQGLAITEPLRYGALLSNMKGKTPPLELADRYAKAGHSVNERLTALSYFYEKGGAADLGHVSKYESDRSKVPECLEDAEGCEWECVVSAGSSSEAKTITTVGEFVRYCIEPAMQKRTKKKPEQANAPKK